MSIGKVRSAICFKPLSYLTYRTEFLLIYEWVPTNATVAGISAHLPPAEARDSKLVSLLYRGVEVDLGMGTAPFSVTTTPCPTKLAQY